MKPIGRLSSRTLVFVSLAADAAAWTFGLSAAIFARYEFTMTLPELTRAALALPLAVGLHTLIGHARLLYRGRYRFGSFEEVRGVAQTVLAATALLLLVDLLMPVRLVPGSAVVVGGMVALIPMLGVRYIRRLQREHARRPDARIATPVLLFGAGSAGHELVRSMLHDQQSRYLPVGFIDDDPAKRHLRSQGVAVLGTRANLGDAIARTGARTVIFSMANAEAELLRDVRDQTLRAGAAFKVLPSVSELLDSRVSVSDVRDPQLTDLLGRHQIETDIDAIAGYLTGKRVLVTGAGGSIGSELCRQIHRFQPAELMMLDRDESALHAVELSLHGTALLDTPNTILADLRDTEGIREIFATRRPQVVFHAAALKHLPLLEQYPGEAVKSNIWGTLTVLEASKEVERFVNISTDKAANPRSVLGYSKRIAERLTAHYARIHEGSFLNVRFGNVLGSRGSVLNTFTAQAAAGGPITVTDPEVTRYFMTVQEAVQLVIQAAAIGSGGEALVLEMGKPVSIAEVARQIAELAPQPVEVVYTGLRPGEKLHEELFGPGEYDLRPLHPLISHVDVPALDPIHTRVLNPYVPANELVAELMGLCQPSSVPVTAATGNPRCL
jgi:FlaA1/EpsC-like NDP-sugar epimerase